MPLKKIFNKNTLVISWSLSFLLHLSLFLCFGIFSAYWHVKREINVPLEVEIIENDCDKDLKLGGLGKNVDGKDIFHKKSPLPASEKDHTLKKVLMPAQVENIASDSQEEQVQTVTNDMSPANVPKAKNVPFNVNNISPYSTSTNAVNNLEQRDTAQGEDSGQGLGGISQGSDEGLGEGLGEGFVLNSDGTYTALSPLGIEYEILRDSEANYPEEARAIGYSDTVSVEGRILVGLDGLVEEVEILNTPPALGFLEEAQKALSKMVFAPIYYRGKNIKMEFLKTIHFEPS